MLDDDPDLDDDLEDDCILDDDALPWLTSLSPEEVIQGALLIGECGVWIRKPWLPEDRR